MEEVFTGSGPVRLLKLVRWEEVLVGPETRKIELAAGDSLLLAGKPAETAAFLLAFEAKVQALEATGVTHDVVAALLHVVGDLPPAVILSVLYLLTSVLTEFLSNKATAILLIPVIWPS